MAVNAVLKTDVVADIKPFTRSLQQASNEAKAFTSKTSSAFAELGKGLAGVFAVGSIISALKNASEQIDSMAASAKKLDISTESFQALSYAAKRSDVEIGTLESGLKRMRTTMAQATGGNAEAIKGFRNLGISVKDLNRPIDEIYAKISEGLQGKTSGQQVGLVNAIFGGKAGQEQLNLLRNNLGELVQEAKDLGFALSDLDIASFDEMDKATDKLAVTIKRDLQGALIAMSPLITGLANLFVKLSVNAGKAFSEISRGIGEGASELSNIFGGNGEYDPNAATRKGINANPSVTRSEKKASKISGAVEIPNVINALSELTSVTKGASAALNAFGEKTLKDLFGVGPGNGKQYLASILGQKAQAMDDTFTKVAKDLQNIVEEGGNIRGVPFQSGLMQLKQIAENAGYNKDSSNSGMIAAVKDIQDASALMKHSQEVTVVVKVKDNEFISAVVENEKFFKSVTDVAVQAADNSARKAVR